MLNKIIKRDGSIEDFKPSKLNKWGIWAGETLGDRVDWSGVIQDAFSLVPSKDGVATSQDLQKAMIDACLERKDYPHNRMAGRLLIAMLRKKLYNDKIPTIKELHSRLIEAGLMVDLGYTDEQYAELENVIKHSRDLELAHFQIEYTSVKYSLTNQKTKQQYETPQFIYMRVAMAAASRERSDAVKLLRAKELYQELAYNRVSAPTPTLDNFGTKNTGLASCCLYKVDDTIPSLHAGDSIAYLMTAASAGIGNTISTRSVGDPVRNGKIIHKGKMPYFSAVTGAVKANTQGSRGGAICTYVPIFDPEIETIMMMQNPRTPEDKRNRNINLAVQSNKFLTQKALKKEDIFLFNSYTAPDLYDSFFSKDLNKFIALYKKYENDDNFPKTWYNAFKLVQMAQVQSIEVGTLYPALMDEINHHTPFLDPIYSSNLCVEITEPTAAFTSAKDLYADDDTGYVEFYTKDGRFYCFSYSDKVTDKRTGQQLHLGLIEEGGSYVLGDSDFSFTVETIKKKVPTPEVALCSLAALVEYNIHSDEQYFKSAYYALYLIEACIDTGTYPFPQVKYTSTQRRNAGVGLSGIAYSLAKAGVKYDSQEGRNLCHQIAERHSYFLIKASLELAKEKGPAPWIHKTLWPRGWLPIDTYKKTVDSLVTVENKYDWEQLRVDIAANGGIRHSSLVAHMPLESSSKANGSPNSIYPIRNLSLSKTDGISKVDWAAIDGDLYKESYQLAWDIDPVDLIKTYAIFQKWADQSISGDLYRDRRGDKLMLSTKDLINEYAAMVKYGLKTRYYQNSITNGEIENTSEDDCAGGACKN